MLVDMLTRDEFKMLFKSSSDDIYEPLVTHMYLGEILGADRECHFLAQAAHESMGFSRFVECLNYGPAGLADTFPKYFKTADKALEYARKPEAIANYVYANRNGNGSEASGDGWRYRGRGIFQCTFKNLYQQLQGALAAPFVDQPDLLQSGRYAAQSGVFYWKSRGLNALADKDNFNGITKAINGGTNGIADRAQWLRKIQDFYKSKSVK